MSEFDISGGLVALDQFFSEGRQKKWMFFTLKGSERFYIVALDVTKRERSFKVLVVGSREPGDTAVGKTFDGEDLIFAVGPAGSPFELREHSALVLGPEPLGELPDAGLASEAAISSTQHRGSGH